MGRSPADVVRWGRVERMLKMLKARPTNDRHGTHDKHVSNHFILLSGKFPDV